MNARAILRHGTSSTRNGCGFRAWKLARGARSDRGRQRVSRTVVVAAFGGVGGAGRHPVALEAEVNSIAAIMKHVGGNLRSRWTEPFTTDGEKPWRDRDAEFVDDFADRDALMAAWNAGWDTLEASLAGMTDADLSRTLRIRGEAHTLALALARSSTHVSCHAGQIVQVARVLASRAGRPWKVLTVPRGGSAAFNRAMGFGSTALG